MDEYIIKGVKGVGDVLVQKSEKGEPLFIGMVKIGKKENHDKIVLIVGTIGIVILLKLFGVF